MSSASRPSLSGFTLIEMLIIAPIIIIFIGVMIVMISSVTGDSLQAREKNAMAYSVQNALDLIETEGSRSATYPKTTGTLVSPQGSNGSTAAFTVTNNDASSTDNDTLLIKTPATTTSPIDSSKDLVYYDSPASCASGENDYYPVTSVYFVAGGSLWQRTILPSTGTPCSTPWQRASCAESSPLTGICKAYDEKLVSDVTNFSVQYLKVDGTPETAANASKAKSVNVTISTSKSVAGKTITYVASTRSVALNGGNASPSSVTFNYTGSLQTWTVPAGVTSVTILAKGAQGGSGTTYTGGLGASMQGTFTVTPGDVLKILVGQEGGSNASYKAGGGGGGSFVTTSSNSPLIVAGGGGGGGGNTSPSNGSPGLTTTSGGSSPAYSGGTSGAGGNAGTGSSGGGGLTGSGTNSGYSGPGMSFTNGGAGGAGGTCAAGGGAGGFGGGSGGEWCQQGAPGAGGGYSGGAGVSSTGVAGGGGSYNGGTNQTNTSGVQSGNGQVKISFTDGEEGSGGGVISDDFIQTITTSNCPTARTMVIDARDNRTYWVQKLADGKCWMLTNLAYAGGGTNTYNDTKTITQTTGDSYTIAYYYIPTGANPTTDPAQPSASTNGTGQYGYLYNWCAAMGVQTGTGACTDATASAPSTSISICPSGWRLPTGGGSGGEFAALNTAVNAGSTSTDAGLLSTWLGQRSGYGRNGFANQGSQGQYWSSTKHFNDSSAYYFNFSNSSASPTSNLYKNFGYAVRCVAM